MGLRPGKFLRLGFTRYIALIIVLLIGRPVATGPDIYAKNFNSLNNGLIISFANFFGIFPFFTVI
jgi:hypothetical protein